MIRKLPVALAGTLAATSAAHAADDYPRLATYAIGGAQDYYNATYQQKLAKVDVAVIAAYPGWGKSKHTTLDASVRQIKGLNPNVKVFAYVIGEAMQVPASSAWVEYEAKINTANWWLYTSGLSTSKVLSDYGRDFY